MLGMVKVYNKGTKPIVWERSHRGTMVIHPGKSDLFGKDKAEEVMKKFANAVSEKEFNELQAQKTAADRKHQDEQKGKKAGGS